MLIIVGEKFPKKTSVPYVDALGQLIIPTNKMTAYQGAIRFRQPITNNPSDYVVHVQLNYFWDEVIFLFLSFFFKKN